MCVEGVCAMIALCTRQGAFLYNCTETEADERISNINNSDTKNPVHVSGGLDYDESGNHREDGMIGWLFMQPNFIRTFEKLGVSACYLEDSGSYRKVTDFEVLNNTYEAVYEKRKEK